MQIKVDPEAAIKFIKSSNSQINFLAGKKDIYRQFKDCFKFAIQIWS